MPAEGRDALVAATAAHGETVIPSNERFALLFEHLAQCGARVETIRAPLGAESLAEAGAVLVGDPREPFSSAEAAGLRTWVTAGGRLLILATRAEVLASLLPGWTLGATLRNWSRLGRSRVRFHDYPSGAPPFEYVEGLSVKPERGPFEKWLDIERASIFVEAKLGAGTVCVLGSSATLSDDEVTSANGPILAWVVRRFQPGLVAAELASRRTRPQRHRLLHGYPMAPLMRDAATHADALEEASLWMRSRGRQLTVGVLPHPFCNPSVKGCGFCTFPHQDYAHSKAEDTVAHVIRELDASPFWREKPAVSALYFGGATANLTPPGSFRALCKKLRERFDLSRAEVTLEGVPAYFVAKKPSLIEVMKEELAARHYRISMGVQTFDPAQIARMGRSAFGDRGVIEEVLEHARGLGLTVSGDFLFNLPGQTRDQMRSDADTAIALGFDQVCLYHLVLAPELGTEWSKDPEMLATLPGNERACESWLDLRERMLGADFVQTTLTNFERRSVHATERRFLYEELGFQPERYDTLGFGPSAGSILLSGDGGFGWGLKLLNPEKASEYAAAVASGKSAERLFVLHRQDLEILFATRRIARLSAPASTFAPFPLELDAIVRAGLMTAAGDTVALTPRGMFYADSVAGLIAAHSVRLQRLSGAIGRSRAPRHDPNVAVPGPMG